MDFGLRFAASKLTESLPVTQVDGRVSLLLMALFVLWLTGGLGLYADAEPVNRPAILTSLEDLATESEFATVHKRAA